MRVIVKIIYGNTALLMIFGSIIGFLFALCVIFFEDAFFVHSRALIICKSCLVHGTTNIFTNSPDFLAWIMLFIIHTGAAVGLGLYALQNYMTRLFKKYHIGWRETLVSLSLILLMVVVSSGSYFLPFISGHYYKLPETHLNNQWLKVGLLHGVGILAASVAALGTISVGFVCQRISSQKLPHDSMKMYFDLKDQLDVYLMVCGYILTSGMVTMYFFMATDKAMHPHDIRFGNQALALLGLMFSIFMAVTFIPSKLLLINLGEKILSEKVADPPANKNDLKKWVDTSKSFEKLLEIKFDFFDTFKHAIPVLTPILAALLPNNIFK